MALRFARLGGKAEVSILINHKWKAVVNCIKIKYNSLATGVGVPENKD
jgi:hypothetical protein